MKRTVSVLIIIVLICFLLISCNTFSNKKPIKGVQINFSELDPNIQEIINIEKQYEHGKYVQLSVIQGKEQKKEVIFNTEESRIDHNFTASLPENRYQIISDQDGMLKVIDNINHQTVLERNLILNDSFSKIKSLSYEWSNTGRYLLIKQVKSGKKILVDIANKRKIDISLEGWFSIRWSNNDEMALVFIDSSKSALDLNISRFIWNIKANTLQNIGYSREYSYEWSPDDSYLFSIGRNKEGNFRISRYSVKDKKWSVIYTTDKTINYESFKSLNNNQFIYAGTGVNQTNDPRTALMRPQQDYVVKFDYSKNIETVRKLDSFLPKVFFWSFDNKYIYYQDYHGFFKAKVDF